MSSVFTRRTFMTATAVLATGGVMAPTVAQARTPLRVGVRNAEALTGLAGERLRAALAESLYVLSEDGLADPVLWIGAGVPRRSAWGPGAERLTRAGARSAQEGPVAKPGNNVGN